MADRETDFNVGHERSGDTVVLTCSGELDIATTPYVEDAVRTILSEPPKVLRLDWLGITFMDSSGIRLLLWIVSGAKENGIDLLWALSAPAQRVLDAVGIHDALLRQLGTEGGPF
jgi:anti-anti-sigma factor